MAREWDEMCSRPGCTTSKGEEYFIERLLGRCYVPGEGVVKYLVAWVGYAFHFRRLFDRLTDCL